MTPGELRDEWGKTDPSLRIVNHTDNHDLASDAYDKRLEGILPPDIMNSPIAFIFGLPGMPLLYNGQEFADSNRHSVWANYKYEDHHGIDWRMTLTLRGKARMELVKKLIRLKKEASILEDGSCKYLVTDHDEAVFAHLRETATQKMLCIYNFRDKELKVSVKDLTIGKHEYILQSGVSISGDMVEMRPYSYAWIMLH